MMISLRRRTNKARSGTVVEDGVERLHDPGHGWPDLGVLAEAVVGDAGDALQAPGREVAGPELAHPPVHDPLQLGGPDQYGPRPVHQVAVAGAGPPARRRQRPPAHEHLQQHDAEAVHVAHHREVACMRGRSIDGVDWNYMLRTTPYIG
jgi:hypothetical protein